MANPITWKNVSGPSFNGIAQLADSAGDSLNRGLQTLATAADTQNQKNIDRNTETAIGEILAMQSMDAVTQAQQDGSYGVEAIRQRFGNQADATKIMAALSKRDDTIFAEQDENAKRANILQQRADKPFIDKYAAALAGAQDEKSLAPILAQIQGDTNISDSARATLLGSVEQRGETLEDEFRSDLKFTQGQQDRTTRLNDLAAEKAQKDLIKEARAYTSQLLGEGKTPADVLSAIQTDSKYDSLDPAEKGNLIKYARDIQSVAQEHTPEQTAAYSNILAAGENESAKVRQMEDAKLAEFRQNNAIDPETGKTPLVVAAEQDISVASVAEELANSTVNGSITINRANKAGGDPAREILLNKVSEKDRSRTARGKPPIDGALLKEAITASGSEAFWVGEGRHVDIDDIMTHYERLEKQLQREQENAAAYAAKKFKADGRVNAVKAKWAGHASEWKRSTDKHNAGRILNRAAKKNPTK